MKIKLYSVNIDCPNPQELAKFYIDLLNWEMPFYDDNFAVIAPPKVRQGSYLGITFQKNPEYQPPVWPTKKESQQQMTHLDFAVDDLDKSVEYATSCGAKVADEQFSDDWKVMIDPVGHPFCLVPMKKMMESDSFKLL